MSEVLPENLTVLVADDHPIFRKGLKQVIDGQSGFSVIAEAADGVSALRLLEEHLPAIAVLDLDMPKMDGFAVAENVKKRSLNIKTIILTMHKDELHVRRAVDLGVDGYVIKDDAAHEIVNCLKTVAGGKEYFSPVLTSILLKRSRNNSSEHTKCGISELTPSERHILLMLSELKTNREIAAILHISSRTVENHRAHICSKLGLHGSHALVRFAVEQKSNLI